MRGVLVRSQTGWLGGGGTLRETDRAERPKQGLEKILYLAFFFF